MDKKYNLQLRNDWELVLNEKIKYSWQEIDNPKDFGMPQGGI